MLLVRKSRNAPFHSPKRGNVHTHPAPSLAHPEMGLPATSEELKRFGFVLQSDEDISWSFARIEVIPFTSAQGSSPTEKQKNRAESVVTETTTYSSNESLCNVTRQLIDSRVVKRLFYAWERRFHHIENKVEKIRIMNRKIREYRILNEEEMNNQYENMFNSFRKRIASDAIATAERRKSRKINKIKQNEETNSIASMCSDPASSNPEPSVTKSEDRPLVIPNRASFSLES